MDYKENIVRLTIDSIIEVHVVGDQTLTSVRKMGDQIKAILSEQQAQQRPAFVLDDITQMGAVPKAAQREVVALGKNLPYDKLAMVGASGLLRFGANLMFQAMGRGNKVKYFTNRDQALAWLHKM